MKHSPIAKAEMLIRKPVAEVFEAFVNPAITSKFWFSKGGGRLEAGKEVTWDWEMYHFSVSVKVKAVEQRADGTTFVSVTNQGFPGNDSEAVQHALDSTEGFAFVLAGAKAFLEYKVRSNLVPDRLPDGIGEH